MSCRPLVADRHPTDWYTLTGNPRTGKHSDSHTYRRLC